MSSKICINYTEKEDVVQDGFSSNITRTLRQFNGLSLSENNYYDVIVGYEIDLDSYYYLVAVEYSTGDSERLQKNGGVEFVDLFRTQEEAESLALLIHNDYQKREDESNYDLLEYTNSIGKVTSFFPPWVGYFESLETINVLKFKIKDNSKPFKTNY